MKTPRPLPFAALGAALMSCIAPVASAQELRLNSDGPGRGAMIISPMMLGGNGPARFGSIDPGARNLPGLLARDDVRNELLITSRQRQELQAVQQEGRPAPIRIEANGDSEASAEESRRLSVERIKTQLDERARQRNEKAQGLLTRRQQERLLELDVQWRGPLALADGPLAGQVGLSPEQRAEIQTLLDAYRAEQQKEMLAAMRDLNLIQERNFAGNNPDGGQVRRVGIMMRLPDPKKMKPEEKARLMKRDKVIEEARKRHGDKAQALLSPEQRAAWKTLQARAFLFRQNEY